MTSLGVGSEATCAVSAGELWCWGRSATDLIRAEERAIVPIRLLFAAGVRAVDVGFYHACAILETDEVVCWGQDRQNPRYQLVPEAAVIRTPTPLWSP